jgi:hypothetical protein
VRLRRMNTNTFVAILYIYIMDVVVVASDVEAVGPSARH